MGVRPGVWCASINGCLYEYDASMSLTASVNMTDNAAGWGWASEARVDELTRLPPGFAKVCGAPGVWV